MMLSQGCLFGRTNWKMPAYWASTCGNLAFIQESNPRMLYPRVDNKIVTKGICHAHGIPVPENYVGLPLRRAAVSQADRRPHGVRR